MVFLSTKKEKNRLLGNSLLRLADLWDGWADRDLALCAESRTKFIETGNPHDEEQAKTHETAALRCKECLLTLWVIIKTN